MTRIVIHAEDGERTLDIEGFGSLENMSSERLGQIVKEAADMPPGYFSLVQRRPTKEEFIARYIKGSSISDEEVFDRTEDGFKVATYGGVLAFTASPCDCTEDDCEGWQMDIVGLFGAGRAGGDSMATAP